MYSGESYTHPHGAATQLSRVIQNSKHHMYNPLIHHSGGGAVALYRIQCRRLPPTNANDSLKKMPRQGFQITIPLYGCPFLQHKSSTTTSPKPTTQRRLPTTVRHCHQKPLLCVNRSHSVLTRRLKRCEPNNGRNLPRAICQSRLLRSWIVLRQQAPYRRPHRRRHAFSMPLLPHLSN